MASQWPILPKSMKTLRRSVLELRVITFPIGYHWKYVRGHCACGESRDPWVGGQKQLHIWNPRPRFAPIIHCATFIGLRRRLRVVYSRGKNILSRRNGAQKWRFFGKMGVETLAFGFATPKRQFLVRNRVVWRIFRHNQCARFGCSLS